MAFNPESINLNQSTLNQIKHTLQQNMKEFAVNTQDSDVGAGQIPTSFKAVWSQIGLDKLSNQGEQGLKMGGPQHASILAQTLKSAVDAATSIKDQIKAASSYVEARTPKLGNNSQFVENGKGINSSENHYQSSVAEQVENSHSVKDQDTQLSSSGFAPWAAGKPNNIKELIDFMASRNIDMSVPTAVIFLYGTGAYDDLRDFNKILNSSDPIAANNQAIGQLFSNTAARVNPNYKQLASSQIVAESGNLLVRNGPNGHQILTAQAANGMRLADIYTTKDSASGRFSLYGITDGDMQAILDNPKVSNDIKNKISPYLGTGFVVGETNYLLNIKLPSFVSTGVFDQYAWNKSDYLTSN